MNITFKKRYSTESQNSPYQYEWDWLSVEESENFVKFLDFLHTSPVYKDAEIVLLGTGPRQRFPHPRLTAPLAQARVGLEVMDLQAACRTYNILVAEERKVAAALLFE